MKGIIAIAIVLCLAVVVYAASNAERIKQLQTRQGQIVVEIDQRNAVIQQQQANIEQLRGEYLKLQGAIEELQRQDNEADKSKEATPIK